MRVLVLYPGLVKERRQLVAPHRWRLKWSGTQLILADDRLHPEDAQVFGDVLQLPPAQRAEEVWQTLMAYVKRHPVDAIVAQSEAGLLLGARLARELGLPGPSVESVLATVDKHASRRLLQKAGVPQPAFALVQDAQALRRFGREHGWPVVLKAVASSRQRLVRCVQGEQEVAHSVAEMRAALPNARDVLRLQSFAELEGLDLGLDPQRQFLVEAFQSGMPLECDGLLVGKQPRWFGVCEQIPSGERQFFIEGYLLPARLDCDSSARVLGVAQDALRALGLENSGVSVELRLTEGAASIIEVNGRLLWDEGLQELVQACTGELPSVLALKLAMGLKLPEIKQRRHAALLYRSNYESAVLRSAPTPKEWKRLTRRARSAWMIAETDQLLLPGEHRDSRPHLAAILCSDRRSTTQALAAARGVLEGLHLDVEVQGSGSAAGERSAAPRGPLQGPLEAKRKQPASQPSRVPGRSGCDLGPVG